SLVLYFISPSPVCLFFSSCPGHNRHPHSFPTRRSSDLLTTPEGHLPWHDGRMSGGEETARLLGRVSLFEGLSDRDLRELAQVAVPRSWLAGQAVFQEGDPGDTCYVIRSGCVRVTRRHSDGRQLALAELGGGDIFGELAM